MLYNYHLVDSLTITIAVSLPFDSSRGTIYFNKTSNIGSDIYAGTAFWHRCVLSPSAHWCSAFSRQSAKYTMTLTFNGHLANISNTFWQYAAAIRE